MTKMQLIIILSTVLILLLIGGTGILLWNNSRSEDKPTSYLSGLGPDTITANATAHEAKIDAQAEQPADSNIAPDTTFDVSATLDESAPDKTVSSISTDAGTESKPSVTRLGSTKGSVAANSETKSNVSQRIAEKVSAPDQMKPSYTSKNASTTQAPEVPSGTSTTSANESKKKISTDSSIPSSKTETEPAQPQAKEPENKPKVSNETKPETSNETKPGVSNETKPESKAECSHTWVWATKTRTIHHDAVIKEGYWHVISEAYDKPVSVRKLKCGHCKKLYDDYDDYAMNDDCDGSYGWVTVDSGQTIHVDEEKEWVEPEVIKEAYDETVTENDYQYCSKCNKRK